MFKSYIVLLLLINLVIYECKWSNSKTSTNKPRETSTKNKTPSSDKFTVVKVADGDTITVRNHSSSELVRIRLMCIDAPEKSQPKWGDESLKKINEMLPLNSKVKLVIDKVDLYGRTIAEVINYKNENVNKKLTELGLAAHYYFQKGCDDYKTIEKKVKTAKLGIWSDEKFQMPWDYRKNMGIGFRGKNSSFAISHKPQKHFTKKIK